MKKKLLNTPRIVEDRIGIGMIENRKGVESLGVRAWEWVLKSSGLCGRGKCKESLMVGAWGKCVESAWVRELKVLGKFGGKGLGMRAWKVRG